MRLRILCIIGIACVSCNLENESTSDSKEESSVVDPETVTEQTPEDLHKAAKAQAKKTEDRQYEIMSAIANPKSKVYTDSATHRKTLKLLAKNEPKAFHIFFQKLNAFRFAQGKEPLSKAALSLQGEIPEAGELAAIDQSFGSCLSTMMEPTNDSALGLTAVVWVPGDPCPNNCVCSAAWAAAEAHAFAFAQCGDGSAAWGEGHGFAFAFAFAYACLPDPAAPVPAICAADPAMAEGCADIPAAADPLAEVASCFTDEGLALNQKSAAEGCADILAGPDPVETETPQPTPSDSEIAGSNSPSPSPSPDIIGTEFPAPSPEADAGDPPMPDP